MRFWETRTRVIENQTTTSTQHPWHGNFCKLLSQALYSEDIDVLRNLTENWNIEYGKTSLPQDVRRRHVPRNIATPVAAVEAVDEIIRQFNGRSHADMGELLTPRTLAAWSNLRQHILKGCLCDPVDVNIHAIEGKRRIGNNVFHQIRTLRGSSALERFHAHQKRWLGPLAIHGEEIGMALLNDGVMRWNRKRQCNFSVPTLNSTDEIFDTGLASHITGLRQSLNNLASPSQE